MTCGAVQWAIVQVTGHTDDGEEIHKPMSEWLDWTLVNKRLRSLLADGYRDLKRIHSGVSTVLTNRGRAL